MGSSSSIASQLFASTAARARLGRWLLVCAIAGSGLGLGAVHTPVLAAVLVVATLAMVLLWLDAEPLEPRASATLLVVVAAGLLGYTALQAVPLPRSVVAALVPETADTWAHALSPLREEGPSFITLSLDPTATRVQLLRGVTYLVVFVGALQVARRQEGVVFLERALVASSIAVAGAALVHPAIGARKVFGLYEPHEWLAYDAHHLGPLLNTNHLAAYANIGCLIAFAAALDQRRGSSSHPTTFPRPLAVAVVVVLAATTVWTMSRGGTGSLVLGALAIVLLKLGRRRTNRVAWTLTGVVAIVGVATLLLSVFDETRAKFVYNDLAKIGLAKNALQLTATFGVFGLGRGAFESVFPKIRAGTDYFVHTHPENVIAQWTTEWGIPIAIIGMGAILWALRPKTMLARSRPPIGAWAAIACVAVHNLVDYSSELPGVVVALAVAGAIVTGGHGGMSSSTPRRREARWSRYPRAVLATLSVASVAAIALTVPHVDDELYNEQRAFRDLGLDRSVSRDAFRDRARSAMLRHPAEPYFPFVGAVRATVVRDESVLPWASRALERSPVYGRVHLLLARSLFARNPSQARLEYRIACEQDTTTCQTDEAARLVSGYRDAMELVPDGARGLSTLSRLTTLLEQRLPSSVVMLDREILKRDPQALEPLRRAALAAIWDLRSPEAWCDGAARAECVEEGQGAARKLRALAPGRCEGHALSAELRVVAGEVDAGFGELDKALDLVTDRSACARRLVTLAVQTNNPARIDSSVDRLLKAGCESPPDCVANLTFAAATENDRGRTRRALVLTKKAWERAPERDDLLIEVAMKSEAQGFHGEALDAYTKLQERHPDDPRWAQGATREKNAAARGVFDHLR